MLLIQDYEVLYNHKRDVITGTIHINSQTILL